MKIKVVFEPYEPYNPYNRFEGSGTYVGIVERATLRECLKVMLDHVAMYLTSERVETRAMTVQDILDNLEARNGNDCDRIYEIVDITDPENPKPVFTSDPPYKDCEVW